MFYNTGDFNPNIPDDSLATSLQCLTMNSKPLNSCTLEAQVQPRSSRNQVDGFEKGILRLRVTAPPTEGQANDGVIALLSKALCISTSRLGIVRGPRSRNKLVSVETLTEQEARHRINSGIKDTYIDTDEF